MRRRRLAARTVVLSPRRSTFLFRYDDVEVGRHWAMPGGGLEPGEAFRHAAARELIEETGWTDLSIEQLICTWEHDFTRVGEPVTQYEQIFVAFGPEREPWGDLAESHQVDEILEWRWWTPMALSKTEELMWPPNLAALIANVTEKATTPAIHLGSR